MIVPDASAVIEVLLQTPAGVSMTSRLLTAGESLHVPHLVDLEVAQVLRRFVFQGKVSAARARQALEDLRDLPLQRYAHDVFLLRIWQLRDNLTAYDATYVALAEALDATLLTCDTRILKASGHRAAVEVV